jgi:hypothetical protein
MRLFAPKPPVDRDEFEWLAACFAWLRTVLDDGHVRPALVLPGDPALEAAGTAPELFEAVRALAGMAGWPCRLEQVEAFDPGDVRIVQGASACGTFSVEDGEAVIRYDAAMLRDPGALTATFAHELCHYLLLGRGDPPGGPDLIEHATDCAAAYIGFGVFQANAARHFEQWQDGTWAGWRASSSGYLSEQALVTAVAMFAALHGYPAEDTEGALKPYLRGDLRKAARAVAHQYPDFAAALGAIDLSEWSFD